MPAPVTSSSSARPASKPATHKQRTQPQGKKTRIVRRRGRAKDGLESDDEIEREVGTDSESEDDVSSVDSDTDDSDTEPVSAEDVAVNGHLPTPDPLDKDSIGHLNGGVAPFFAPPGNWSEMVADETANGPADLPVIEFADFESNAVSSAAAPSKKAKKPAKKTRPASVTAPTPSPPASAHGDTEEQQQDPNSAPSTSQRPSHSPFSSRPPGQTARQAYQQRLESDPSYVPKVGGFWGHDDRLMDKDLRSLSTWWRGRWQGRGRGGFSMRGRGRGGFPGAQQPFPPDANDDQAQPSENLPPIEKAWTHDGFEEMKRREEQRRATQQTQQQQQQQPGPQPFHGPGGIRGGRGGFVPNRGGRGGFVRGGGFLASPRSRANAHLMAPGRVWFAMKPELMWTKQHDAFLYFDTALKPRPGQGASVRVKLPGSQGQSMRAPLKPLPLQKAAVASTAAPASEAGSEVSSSSFVVRLPKRAGKEKAMEPVTTVDETPLEEIFTVRPHLVTPNPIPIPESATAQISKDVASAPANLAPLSQALPPTQPEASIVSQLEQISITPKTPDPERWAKTEEAVLRRPSIDGRPEAAQPEPVSEEPRPPLAPLQTVFTPPPVVQPSPVYGSPYGYASALPPGIGMNQHGMPYELATGRPVYLQAPAPPPPPMYDPRTFNRTPFTPRHMHHPSAVSSDFVSHTPSHTPPVNGFIDPSTGTPIFSFPRQSSRIEIRAPTEDAGGKPAGKLSSASASSAARTPSGLRTAAATFEPSRPSETMEHGYYSGEGNALPSYETADGGEDGQAPQHVDPGMMAYPPYQQQYYYPEAYGYPPYVDMSQAGQYDMYPMDHPGTPQGTVYY